MNFYMRTVTRTNSYLNIFNKKSQLDYYIEKKAHKATINLVQLNNKTFGERMQKIVIEMLNLDKSTNTSHDARKYSMELKFEIKSSRYWVKKEDFRWQHIMRNHDYDYLLLTGLDFDEILLYIISKNKLLELLNKNIVKQQGGAEGQGIWFDRNDITQYLQKIDSKYEFYNYLKENKNLLQFNL